MVRSQPPAAPTDEPLRGETRRLAAFAVRVTDGQTEERRARQGRQSEPVSSHTGRAAQARWVRLPRTRWLRGATAANTKPRPLLRPSNHSDLLFYHSSPEVTILVFFRPVTVSNWCGSGSGSAAGLHRVPVTQSQDCDGRLGKRPGLAAPQQQRPPAPSRPSDHSQDG